MTKEQRDWTVDRRRAQVLLVLVGLVAGAASGAPRDVPRGYQRPSEDLVALVDAPPAPLVQVDPLRRWLLVMERPGLLPLSRVAREERQVAGLAFLPEHLGHATGLAFTGLALRRLADGTEPRVTGLPEAPWLQDVQWSPDGRHVAFTHAAPGRLEAWVLEVESGVARRLSPAALHGVAGAPCRWMPDARSLVCRLVPETWSGPTAREEAPSGPHIEESPGTRGGATPEAPGDDASVAAFLTTQLARLGLDGERVVLGGPALLTRAEPSPDGAYLLVETLRPPFPSGVSASRLPRRIELWSAKGDPVRTLADLPLEADRPRAPDAVRPGPREVGWRADAPATVAWVQAEDGGDPTRPARVRDGLYTLSAPFQGTPTRLASLALRFRELHWGDARRALVTEGWEQGGQLRRWRLDPSRPRAALQPLATPAPEPRGRDVPLLRDTGRGTRVLLTPRGGRTLLMTGEERSPEGLRAFLDTVDLDTGARERWWRAEGPVHEVPLAVLDPERRLLLTRQESTGEPPAFLVRDLRANTQRRLLSPPHPAPVLKGVRSELLRYERADGVKLTARLLLPPGYKEGDGPLPVLVWAYPQDYRSADAAGEDEDTPYRFPRVEGLSPRVWLLRGYAVLEGPTMPLLPRDGRPPNDTYVEQLVANARAAVDALVRRGVADRERIAIGGHSYGAAMVATLLAHTDLFRAGLALSGAYNRTLTPFGFQAERRTLWQAPEVYLRASALGAADRIRAPLLLLHGQADPHPSTPFSQSEALYRALVHHGAPARLVGLPGEGHTPRARESVLHALWELERWLERYVKHAPPRPPGPERSHVE